MFPFVHIRSTRRVVFSLAGACLLLSGLLVFAFDRMVAIPDVQRLAAYQPGAGAVVLDRHGVEITRLLPVRHRVVAIDSLPPYVPNAFIAIEDRRFRHHHGVDLWRVGGAALHNLKTGGMTEGSSTITMQLARNLFPEIPMNERTLGRKLAEMRAAIAIENAFSKTEILELYLNHIYFGNGAFGIEAASRRYFGKPAARLTPAEAALLAALPKAPAHYDPYRAPEKALRRRDLVLAKLREQGYLDAAGADSAAREDLGVIDAPPEERTGRTAAYFTAEVRRILEERFGDRFYRRPLEVHTTLDLDMQRAAEEELGRQLDAIDSGRYGPTGDRGGTAQSIQGAFVALDVVTGDVLAWVGGRDARRSAFDRVADARRQAGSTFKPFVYAAALAAGTPLTRRLEDEPLRIELAGDRAWEPVNYGGRFHGLVSVREALVRSLNVPTVRLAEDVGIDRVAALARDAGITSRIDETPAMALGTVAVSPLELTAAFTSFAGLGRRVEPRLVTRVESADGRVLMTVPPKATDAIDRPVAYLINDVLHDVVTRGTGTAALRAGYSGTVAGKTGTSSRGVDAWFIGYTPRIAAGVWIGFDWPERIVPGASGGRLAAPVWGRVMKRAAPADTTEWTKPWDVVWRPIDPATGDVVEDDCLPPWEEPRYELFLRGAVPRAVCPDSGDAEWTPWADDTGGALPEFAGLAPPRETPRSRPGAGPDLEGWWTLNTVVTSSADADLRGRRVTYRVHLQADGEDVSGQGLRNTLDGVALDGAGRTAIAVRGRRHGRNLHLRFTEYGPETTSGWFDYDVSNGSLVGDFRCVTMNVFGSSVGHRVN